MSRRLYQFAISGHCHRVALMLALLGLPYERVEVDLFKRAQREPGFLALNPLGQVPVLDDEGQVLSDSNAILVYLAMRYPGGQAWLPQDALGWARLQRWFSLAASWLDEGPATARFARLSGREVPAQAVQLAERLFGHMEQELQRADWLLGAAPSLADVALYTYTAHAPEGGIELAPYPRLRAWLARVEALPGFVPMVVA